MAAGTTDPLTVEAEMNGRPSPADRPADMSDEEWEAAAPSGQTVEAEGDEDLPPVEGEAEDDEAEAADGKKTTTQTEAFPGSEEIPDIDEALEFHAQLLKVQDTSGSQGDNIQAHFEAPWQDILQVVNRYKKALELRFGNVSVFGASLIKTVTNTDADGNVRLKVTFAIPESQKQRASELFMLTGRGGPLSIEPTQLSLDGLLTKRADDDEDFTEDNPTGSFSDVSE